VRRRPDFGMCAGAPAPYGLFCVRSMAALNAGGDASVTSVSCPAAGVCAAAGGYKPKKGPGQLFVVNEAAGQWKPAIQLANRGVKHPGVPRGQDQRPVGPVRGARRPRVHDHRAVLPGPGYCAAGGQRLNSNPENFTASMMAIDEVAGRWGKTVSLHSGCHVISDTYSIYAISCAAPRSCGAGGILAAYHGLPYGVVANEMPVKLGI